jgi:hypothetical protein
MFEVAIDDVQVRPADGAGRDPYQDLLRAGFRDLQVPEMKRLTDFFKQHGSHSIFSRMA